MRVPAHLTLLGKPGCHLCDDAREALLGVLEEFPEVTLEERSILDDPRLLERFSEEIPVLLIDGVVHDIWRIDPVRLKNSLTEVAQ